MRVGKSKKSHSKTETDYQKTVKDLKLGVAGFHLTQSDTFYVSLSTKYTKQKIQRMSHVKHVLKRRMENYEKNVLLWHQRNECSRPSCNLGFTSGSSEDFYRAVPLSGWNVLVLLLMAVTISLSCDYTEF